MLPLLTTPALWLPSFLWAPNLGKLPFPHPSQHHLILSLSNLHWFLFTGG